MNGRGIRPALLASLLLLGWLWHMSSERGPRLAPLVVEVEESPGRIESPGHAELPRIPFSSEGPADPSPASEPSRDPWHDWLQGTVVGPDGTPIEGAWILALRGSSSNNTQLWKLDHGFRYRIPPAARGKTGTDGRFRFLLERGVSFDLEAGADGMGAGFAPMRFAGEEVLLALTEGHSVRGRLTRESDGTPIEDALVRVIESYSCATRETRSASDGTYHVAYPFQWTSFHEKALPGQGSAWVFGCPLAIAARRSVRVFRRASMRTLR